MPGDYSDLIGKQFNQFNQGLEDNAPASPIKKWFAEVQAGRISPQHAALLAKHEMQGNPLGVESPAAPQAPAAGPATPAAGPGTGLAPLAQSAQPAPVAQRPQSGGLSAPQGFREERTPPPPDLSNLTNRGYQDFMAGAAQVAPRGQSDMSRLQIQQMKDNSALTRAQIEALSRKEVATTQVGGAKEVAGIQVGGRASVAGANNASAEKIASELNASRERIAALQATVQREGHGSANGRDAQQKLQMEISNIRNNIQELMNGENYSFGDPNDQAHQLVAQLKAELDKLTPSVQVPLREAPTPAPTGSEIAQAGRAGAAAQPPTQGAAPQRKKFQGRYWIPGPGGKAILDPNQNP